MLQTALTVGWRNLRRNPRRTLTTAFSVAFGVCVAVVILGTRQSTYDTLIAHGAQSGYGHVTLSQPGYFGTGKRTSMVQATPALLAALKALPGVEHAVPRILATAVAATAKTSAQVALIGLDPAQESAATNLMLAGLSAGRGPLTDDPHGCALGSGLATHLGLKLNQKVILTTTASDGQIVSSLAYVRGLVQTGNPELDGHILVMPLSGMQEMLGFSALGASFIALYTASAADTELVAAAARHVASGLAPGTSVVTWHESLKTMAQAIAMDASLYRLLILFAGAIIAVGIFNAMMLSIRERRRELGILLALGLSPFHLILMVAWEALTLGLIGLGLGAILATPLYSYLHWVGLDLGRFLGEQEGARTIAVDQVLGCRLTSAQMAATAGTLLATSVVAALIPAIKASRTEPLKAIRDL